jgi:hypothetical protein
VIRPRRRYRAKGDGSLQKFRAQPMLEVGPERRVSSVGDRSNIWNGNPNFRDRSDIPRLFAQRLFYLTCPQVFPTSPRIKGPHLTCPRLNALGTGQMLAENNVTGHSSVFSTFHAPKSLEPSPRDGLGTDQMSGKNRVPGLISPSQRVIAVRLVRAFVSSCSI